LGTLKSRPKDILTASIIVHASRITGTPLTIKKVSKFIEKKEKAINKVFMFLKKKCRRTNENKASKS